MALASSARRNLGHPQLSPEEKKLEKMLREEARKRDYGDGAFSRPSPQERARARLRRV